MFYKVTLGFTTGATYNMTNVHVFKAAQARWAYFFVCYRPQRSCGQGNIFTPVCHSFCSQEGRGSASVHAGMPAPPDQADPPGTRDPHPQLGRPPPPDQADTPRTRQIPPESRRQHTVNERPVRILLECILVFFCDRTPFVCIYRSVSKIG